MGNAFFESSTRTRLSFMQAAENMGMKRLGFGSSEGTAVKKNESLHHTLEMLRGYGSDVIVIRHALDGAAQYAADLMDVPVINAGDGQHQHPTQTMLDLFSILETQDKLDGLKVAFVGDLKYGRTVHSLIKALRKFGNNTFHVAHPEQLGLPEEYQGDDVQPISLDDALLRCDIVYRTRVQLERIEDQHERAEAFGKLQLTPEMFEG